MIEPRHTSSAARTISAARPTAAYRPGVAAAPTSAYRPGSVYAVKVRVSSSEVLVDDEIGVGGLPFGLVAAFGRFAITPGSADVTISLRVLYLRLAR